MSVNQSNLTKYKKLPESRATLLQKGLVLIYPVQHRDYVERIGEEYQKKILSHLLEISTHMIKKSSHNISIRSFIQTTLNLHFRLLKTLIPHLFLRNDLYSIESTNFITLRNVFA